MRISPHSWHSPLNSTLLFRNWLIILQRASHYQEPQQLPLSLFFLIIDQQPADVASGVGLMTVESKFSIMVLFVRINAADIIITSIINMFLEMLYEDLLLRSQGSLNFQIYLQIALSQQSHCTSQPKCEMRHKLLHHYHFSLLLYCGKHSWVALSPLPFLASDWIDDR